MKPEEYYPLISTGEWRHDLVLYLIIGALIFANIRLIKSAEVRRKRKGA